MGVIIGFILLNMLAPKEKIYRIKNPAFKVTDFMFDQNWLKIAEPDESIQTSKRILNWKEDFS